MSGHPYAHPAHADSAYPLVSASQKQQQPQYQYEPNGYSQRPREQQYDVEAYDPSTGYGNENHGMMMSQLQPQRQRRDRESGYDSRPYAEQEDRRYDYEPKAPKALLEMSTDSSDGNILNKPKKQRVFKTALGDFSPKDLLKRKYWKYYAILILLSVVVALATIYHDDIIRWLQPLSEKVRDLPAGWTIWVAILFVISFPPLFGHEVICLLCGLIYGLWIGFAIVCLGTSECQLYTHSNELRTFGTVLGEWGNFLVFRYSCAARARRMEQNDITFACITRVIREGGFMIAFMARLSALPGHLTTPWKVASLS